MSVYLVDPKVDSNFKLLFGMEKDSTILISFLNSCIKSEDKIVEIYLRKAELSNEFTRENISRIRVLAKTEKGESYNIEILRKDEENMINQSIYECSKSFAYANHGKTQYAKFTKVVSINILDFILFDSKLNYHNQYMLTNVNDGDILTNIEIHYIELPKMTQEILDDNLSYWTAFIKNPNDMRVIEMETEIVGLREARTRLTKISKVSKEMMAYILKANSLNSGIEAQRNLKNPDEKVKIIEIAKKIVGIASDEIVIEKTGLTLEEVEELKNQS